MKMKQLGVGSAQAMGLNMVTCAREVRLERRRVVLSKSGEGRYKQQELWKRGDRKMTEVKDEVEQESG